MTSEEIMLPEEKPKEKIEVKRQPVDYEKWAFPYGSNQRNAMEKLVREVYPGVSMGVVMMGFLTCKEIYEKADQSDITFDEMADYLINSTKEYRSLIKKHEMPRCVAFVLIDSQIDENLNYPTATQMREIISKYEKMRKKRGLFK